MDEAFLRTEKMAVGYEGKALIQDICLGIKKGEITALIGPNGSGKSTILKSLSRQLGLIGGKAVLAAEDMKEISYRELSRKMALVLTERIHPELMTCREVVAMGRYPYTGSLGILGREDERQIRKAMEAVRIMEIADKDFQTISDGQRQRVMLARAICQEPEIIVLDEPTSFLDIRYKIELLEILRSMAKKQQIAVLLSLHEIDLAQKAADRIVCVKGERISGYGTPEEIVTEECIRELYDMDEGFYDPLTGGLELKKPEGEPQIFVISSGGRGIPVYRKLQREGIPFAAGILYSNDADYQTARYLASEVIEEVPFEEISDRACRRAAQMIDLCGCVINAGVQTGHYNRKIEILLKYAESTGKLKKIDK